MTVYPDSIKASKIARIIQKRQGLILSPHKIASKILHDGITDIVITHGHPNKYSIMLYTKIKHQ